MHPNLEAAKGRDSNAVVELVRIGINLHWPQFSRGYGG
jgi:hypothetical protein